MHPGLSRPSHVQIAGSWMLPGAVGADDWRLGFLEHAQRPVAFKPREFHRSGVSDSLLAKLTLQL